MSCIARDGSEVTAITASTDFVACFGSKPQLSPYSRSSLHPNSRKRLRDLERSTRNYGLVLFATGTIACDTSPPNALSSGAPNSTTVTASPTTPRDIAASAFESTVLLAMQDANGQPISVGSGFVVSEGIVATNYHVIRGAAAGTARIVGRGESAPVSGVIAVRPEVDLALLVIEGLSAPSLALRADLPSIGETVFAVGNPQGLEGTFSAGIVSGIRQMEGLRLLQITAPISPGSSGGPVLDDRGAVVGVATATYRQGQNLNFAVPAMSVRDALDSAGEARALRAVTRAPSSSSWSSRLGDPAIEGLEARQFRWNTSNPYLDAAFSFSLQNKLEHAVHNVTGIVVFYDAKRVPLDYIPYRTSDLIPAGLATRVHAMGDKSVKEMITGKDRIGVNFLPVPRTSVEIRVLTFDVVR